MTNLPDVDCVFCGIVSGTAPATIVREWPDALAFVPLGPVIAGGHVLVVPRRHVADAVEDPAVTAATMARAAELAAEHEASNILTSVGAAATQSVFHLHVHVIRRTVGDQLMVPWGTTGNPHDPHSCARSTKAETLLVGVECVLLDHVAELSGPMVDPNLAELAYRYLAVAGDSAPAEIRAAMEAAEEAAARCLRCGGAPCSECDECPRQGCWDCRCDQRDRNDEEERAEDV